LYHIKRYVQVLWDILTFVVVSSGLGPSAGHMKLPVRTSPSEAHTASGATARKKEDIASVFAGLTSDLSKRSMVLAGTIVSQREEEWRLDVESRLLHTTVEASMKQLEEVRQGRIRSLNDILTSWCRRGGHMLRKSVDWKSLRIVFRRRRERDGIWRKTSAESKPAAAK
jgi:hypothetical protein